jgi:transposase-like protein
MPRKHHKPEEIVAKLRQVDVLVSQGQNIADRIRQIGVSEVTYYRWRQEYGGLKTDQVKRLKELEHENNRLRRQHENGRPRPRTAQRMELAELVSWYQCQSFYQVPDRPPAAARRMTQPARPKPRWNLNCRCA